MAKMDMSTSPIQSSPKRSRVGSNASSFANGGGGGDGMMGGAMDESNHNHVCLVDSELIINSFETSDRLKRSVAEVIDLLF